MMNKLAVSVLALILLGAIGFVAYRMTESPASDSLDATTADESNLDTDDEVGRARRIDVSEANPENTLPSEAPPGVKETSPDQAPKDPASRRFLHVVDRESQEPIPNVEIRLISASTWMEAVRKDPRRAQIPTAIQSMGTVIRSDAEGRAVWYRPNAESYIAMVDSPTLLGFEELDALEGATEDKPARIRVMPQTRFSVQVDTARGTPASGVTVALVPDAASSDQRGFSRPLGVTDATGRAEVRWHEGYRQRPGGDDQKLFVSVIGLLDEAPRVALDPDALPTTPLRLELPPCGTVAVRMEDPEGQPFVPTGAGAGVTIARADANASSVRRGLYAGFLSSSFDAETGLAQLFPVGLDLDVTLHLNPGPTDAFAKFSVDGRGPDEDGATSTVTARIQELRPMLTGRLVHENGEPAAEVTFSVSRERYSGSGSSSSSTGGFTTDAEGRFRVKADVLAGDRSRRSTSRPSAAEQKTVIKMVFTVESQGDPNAPPILASLTSTRGEVPESGGGDLGDLVITPPPILAAGRIVLGDGSKVPSYSAHISSRALEGSFRMWQGVSHRHGWQRPVDDEGRFELRGLIEELEGEREYQLSFAGSPFDTEEIMITPGQTGILVHARMHASVKGRLLGDPELTYEQFSAGAQLKLVSLDNPDPTTTVTSRTQKDGTFSFPHVPPGRYRLDLKCRFGFEATLIDAIELASRDERDLGDINVDPLVQRYTLRLTTTDGSALPEKFTLYLRTSGDSDSGESWSGHQFKTDRPAFFHGPPPVTVRVEVGGFRKETAELRTTSTEIRLAPSPRIVVKIDTTGLAIPDRVVLVPGLMPTGSPFPGWPTRSKDSTTERSTFFVNGPGTFRVSAELKWRSQHGHEFGNGKSIPLGEITVTDDPDQEFSFEIPADEKAGLPEAAKALRERFKDF